MDKTNLDSENVREQVRQGYGKIATSGGGCCGTSCCGSGPAESQALAERIGYSADELQALPEGANMGLSCGNPVALASLKSGQIVLDLGSGGGFDVFIAGQKVGPDGRVIGVDMTPEMLGKARRNSAAYTARTKLNNVEFRLGEIEHLPVADKSIDVIISNCVINLSPNKPQVWREMYRVLKPGGRVAVSDLSLFKPLPPQIVKIAQALVGCIAGASLVAEVEEMARDSGFGDVVLTPHSEYVEAMSQWNDPLYAEIVQHLPPGTKPADFITSLSISAIKPRPARTNCC